MPTLADAVTDATTAENQAADALNAAADLLRNKSASAQTVINNFLARPSAIELYVDPGLGDDTKDGSTLTTPVKTFDRAMQLKGRDGFTKIFLLGDIVVLNIYNLFAPVHIAGIVRGNGASGLSYSFTNRKITFASEAAGSPVAGIGRTVAGFFVNGPFLRYLNIDLVWGDPVAGFGNYAHHQLFGTSLQCSNCTMAVPRAGVLSALVAGADAAMCDLEFTGTVGANVAGHIVQGVPAGSSPNSTFFRSNMSVV